MKILEADAPKLEGPDWSQEFRDIVLSMLNKKPQERPTCRQLLDNEANNFLKKASNSSYI
jgi:serine/threonine protein kinase